MKNNLVRGVRKASDFLMALQLTGAFKRGALPNLQARLPAVVIGGGLTGIDTATELFAYYPSRSRRCSSATRRSCAERGERRGPRRCTTPRSSRSSTSSSSTAAPSAPSAQRADAAGERPDFVPLVRSWGGVTLAYRKRMVDSPAYRLNHEEVIKALEEGIWFAENLDPREIIADEHESRCARWCSRDRTAAVELPARTILVAAGTSPNITYEKEQPGTFQLDAKRKFFQGFRAEGTGASVSLVPDHGGFFTSYNNDGRLISYYGDNHPAYAGNVVKAMASAKHGYPHVAALFADDIEPAARTGQRRNWTRSGRASSARWTMSCWRESSGWSG